MVSNSAMSSSPRPPKNRSRTTACCLGGGGELIQEFVHVESLEHSVGMVVRVAPPVCRLQIGGPKSHRADEVQLCAQALCLEEMLDLPAGAISFGALFYGATRRRFETSVDAGLRRLTESAAERLHSLIASCVTPRVARETKCDRCSLVHLCLPDATAPHRSAARFLGRTLAEFATI